MSNFSPIELIMILLVLAVLLVWTFVIVRILRLAWGGENAGRVRELETHVREAQQER
jgi:biopolymer transport protein ExbB/TolQ